MVTKETPAEKEYFIRQEIERLKVLREKHLRETVQKTRDEMKQLHHMHCAKCGQHMETTILETVEIEVCPDCGGIYLDAGELGKILDEKVRGPFANALAFARKLWIS